MRIDLLLLPNWRRIFESNISDGNVGGGERVNQGDAGGCEDKKNNTCLSLLVKEVFPGTENHGYSSD